MELKGNSSRLSLITEIISLAPLYPSLKPAE